MQGNCRKIIIIVIMAFLLILVLYKVNARAETEQNISQLLTEMSVDIRYIKNSISEIKEDNQDMRKREVTLGSRVTRVEERQITIKASLCDVTERNNWFMGLIGTLMILTLGMQIKRSSSHRKNSGNNNNKTH